jgi:hypothetical protein
MKVRFALDSGAYSLFTNIAVGYHDDGSFIRGEHARQVIDYSHFDTPLFEKYVYEYMDYVKFFGKSFDFHVTVDVIGDAERTERVLRWFDKAGLVPMPVYHYGVNFEWLKKWADRYPYIGIGGVPIDTTLHKYIDHGNRIFGYFGRTRAVKTHGFALTAFQLLTIWPWTSVDSTSPSMHGRFGNLMMPQIDKHNGILRYDYSRINNILTVSTRRSSHRGHIAHRNSELRMLAEEYLETIGSSMAEVSESHLARDVCNYIWIDRFLKAYEQRYDRPAPVFWKSGKYSSAPTKVPQLITRMADNGVDALNYMGTFFRLDGMRVVNKLLDHPVFLTNRQLKRAIRDGRSPVHQSFAPRFRLVKQYGHGADNEPLLLPARERPRLRRPDGDDSPIRQRLRLWS